MGKTQSCSFDASLLQSLLRLPVLKAHNEMQFLKSGAKPSGVSVVHIGSITEEALPCVLWEFAGSPLPAKISQDSLPALLSDVASALAVLQVLWS